MNERKLIFSTLSLTLACAGFLFVVAARGQAERTIVLFLSTEVLPPGLIFGLAVIAYFSRKQHNWRYIQ